MYIKGYGRNGFEGQTFHVHVRELAGHDELYFRDYLIAHPETAKEYGELKQAVQKKYKHDRDSYTFAKSEFISQITKLAKCECKNKYESGEGAWFFPTKGHNSLSYIEKDTPFKSELFHRLQAG